MKFIYITILIIILAVLLALDFVPSGRLEVSYGFNKPSPYISRLSPDGRVLEIMRNKSGEYYQIMAGEPVYFDVRLPQTFERVKAEIFYDKPKDAPFSLGFRAPGEWSWIVKEINPAERSGNWTHGMVKFNLSGAYYDNRRLRFILASPGIDESGYEIKIGRIHMTFTKEALRLDNFWGRVKEYARTWIQ